MPGFDGTGPKGAGAMTGGARGYCNFAGPGRQTAVYGGIGYGRGGGFGRGYGFYRQGGHARGYGRGSAGCPPVYAEPFANDPAGELDMLKARANAYRHSLESIQQRIADLEKPVR